MMASSSSLTAEGKRATALRTVLNRSVDKTIQTCSYDKVAQSLPTLSNKTPDQLRYALDQSLNFLKTQILSSFEEIISERQAVSRLNELDNLIEDAKSRKAKGEPPMQSPVLLPPESLVRAHTLPLKRVELARLEAKLAEIHARNDELLKIVDGQRGEIDSLNKAMRNSLEDLEAAVGSACAIPLTDMRDSMEEIIPSLRG